MPRVHPAFSWPLVWLVCVCCVLAADSPRARIVVAQDPDAIQHFDVNAERVRELVNQGILRLTHKTQIADAWREFAQPADVVGIKIVARGGPLFAVHKDLVDAVVDGLKAAGVPDNHILIWDKYQSDLVEAGYPINESTNGVRVMGVIPNSGFDAEVKYRASVAGKIIWGDYLFGKDQEISADSHMARIVTEKITKLINVAVLCNDYEVGLSGCLLNVALGSVDNVRRFQNDPAACETAVPDICSMGVLRDKMVLHILDGLLGQYALGPYFHPQYTWHHGAIYFSTDPVALDTVALTEIESHRAKAGFPPLDKRARYIENAAAAGLGIADTNRIDVVKIQR